MEAEVEERFTVFPSEIGQCACALITAAHDICR